MKLYLILSSSRVIEILKAIMNHSMTRRELKEMLGFSSSALTQILNKMTKLGLIEEHDDIIRILPKGKLILEVHELIKEYEEFLTKINNYINYYILDDLPNNLIKRFYELSDIVVVERKEDVLRPHREFIEGLMRSKEIYGYTTVFFPEYVDVFLEFAEEGKRISIIVNKNVLKHIIENYEKELKKGLEYKNVNFYVSNKNYRISFIVSDVFFSISFYLRDGMFDYRRDFVCKSEDCRKWGLDLFNYIVKNSVRVDKDRLKELIRSL